MNRKNLEGMVSTRNYFIHMNIWLVLDTFVFFLVILHSSQFLVYFFFFGRSIVKSRVIKFSNYGRRKSVTNCTWVVASSWWCYKWFFALFNRSSRYLFLKIVSIFIFLKIIIRVIICGLWFSVMKTRVWLK